MNIVKKLPPHVADLIAAGEVVERPASVIKELMENAVDAGATQVTVEIRNGGIDLIRVTDNGCGMSREDAQTCFIRHATSKIATEDDLHAILTLGFRGEALAAIAAVSRVELTTRMAEDDVGTCVRIVAGEIQSVEDAGCPVGTTISVEKLFYNTPARMKFLKKNATEAGYCAAAADKLALAHPEVAFRFVKDGRDAMRTPGDGKLYSAIYGVCGKDFAGSLVEVRQDESVQLGGTRILVWGYVTKPERAVSTRNSQYFMLNGRFIRSRTMAAALEEAYRGSMMVGKYPGCVLQAAIDPAYVDVNVHPAKTEIKFADERAAFEAVYVAVKRALENASRPVFSAPRAAAVVLPPKEVKVDITEKPVESKVNITPELSVKKSIESAEVNRNSIDITFVKPTTKVDINKTSSALPGNDWLLRSPAPMYHKTPDISAADFETGEEEKPSPLPAAQKSGAVAPTVPAAEPPAFADPVLPEKTPETLVQEIAEETPTEPFRIVGELFHSYIVVELADEILYVDKHAAHERILYNELKARETEIASQLLLTPVVLPLSSDDLELLESHREALSQAGIEAEDFGGGSLIVHAIPQHITADQTAELIADVCGRLKSGEPDSIRENILHSIACKAAIKAGWHTDPREWEVLVEKVLRLPDVRYCPHGRPVALVTSRREFEKGFRRIV
ncbi:MAG: DNA mismatch repair endonuclease MutL [Ruminococcaceae bacterium]|nr:DNA mismatch repair endonuclease MutL [Oscillospiraceae bacterium]